jgi:hypothetical protein
MLATIAPLVSSTAPAIIAVAILLRERRRSPNALLSGARSR